MKEFVFVHGAWSGGWCWDEVRAALERKGYSTHAIDLPGHGRNPMPVDQISPQAYLESLEKELSEKPSVILVGHSVLGGWLISQFAENRPEKVIALVYVAAFLPSFYGQSYMDVVANNFESVLAKPGNITTSDGRIFKLDFSVAREALYNECSEKSWDTIRANRTNLAVLPLKSPLQKASGEFEKLDKYYVSCSKDQAIVPTVQRELYKNRNCKKVFTLEADHSPFFSTPCELADVLDSVAMG